MKTVNLGAIGVPTDILRFDAFELNACQEIDGNVEPMLDGDIKDGIPVFWSVYGHLPEGGVEALVDVTDEASAIQVVGLLKMLHAGAKEVQHTANTAKKEGPNDQTPMPC